VVVVVVVVIQAQTVQTVVLELQFFWYQQVFTLEFIQVQT
jgi:hypothetical protein